MVQEFQYLKNRIAALEAVQAEDRLSLESWKKRANEAEDELLSSAETGKKTTCKCAEQQQRIAELEAKLETATQSMLAERMRADAAKAKLARVKEWAEKYETNPPGVWTGVAFAFDDLYAILADTKEYKNE